MKAIKTFILCMLVMQANVVMAQLTFPHIRVLYDSAWTHKNLQLIPIRFSDSLLVHKSLPSKFLTLDNALKKKQLVIRENNFLGRENVNVLNVKNASKDFIFMLGGTLLKGGKQDRMLGESKLLAPSKEYDFLNVYCVEKERWDKKATSFSYGGFAALDIRKAADSSNVQQHVWKKIEEIFVENKLKSTTYPYLEVQKKNKAKLPDYYTYFKEKFSKSDSLYAGFIVISDSSIIACDVFANEQLLASSFDNLLQSYLAIVKNENAIATIQKNKLINFANQLFGSEIAQKKFLEHHGKLFMYNNKPLHIVAYGER